VARASWPDQRIVRAPLGDLVAAMQASPVERTALILVGPALAGRGLSRERAVRRDYVRRFRGGAIIS